MDYFDHLKYSRDRIYTQEELDFYKRQFEQQFKEIMFDKSMTAREKDFEIEKLKFKIEKIMADHEFREREQKLFNDLEKKTMVIDHKRELLSKEETIARQNLMLDTSKMRNELGMGDDSYRPPGNAKGIFGELLDRVRKSNPRNE